MRIKRENLLFLLPCLFALILSLININALAQPALKYKISGHINADTGSINLVYAIESAFYPAGFKQQKARIINGYFEFEGTLPYPQGVMLFSDDKRYMSANFVIEPGVQNITCNIDSNRKVPIVNNKAMLEYTIQYLPLTAELARTTHQLNKLRDSLNSAYHNQIPAVEKNAYMTAVKNNYAQSDKLLLKYIQARPNSYFAFWRLVHLSAFGYEPILDSMYKAFSPAIKNTYTGRILAEKLKSAGALIAIGKKFPDLKAVSLNGEALNKLFYKNAKYTLIDFWYSGCGPCRAQFPALKEIYKRYQSKGLEIIGISTDKTIARQDLVSAISAIKLPWFQYWDKNGIEAKRLTIGKFPTNFLINADGVIIRTDLAPEELDNFLSKALPQK